MELRDRQPLRPPEESTELKNVSRADGDEKSEKRSPHKFPTWYSLVVLFYCLGVFALVVTTDRRLPAPLTGDQRDRFVEARARRYLKQLASVGPRPAGANSPMCFVCQKRNGTVLPMQVATRTRYLPSTS